MVSAPEVIKEGSDKEVTEGWLSMKLKAETTSGKHQLHRTGKSGGTR